MTPFTEASVGTLWFNADPISFILLFHICELVLKAPCLSKMWRCLAKDVAGGTVGCGSSCSLLICMNPLHIKASSDVIGR